MHITTCGIAAAKIGSTENKRTPNLLDSLSTNILLLDSGGQKKIKH